MGRRPVSEGRGHTSGGTAPQSEPEQGHETRRRLRTEGGGEGGPPGQSGGTEGRAPAAKPETPTRSPTPPQARVAAASGGRGATARKAGKDHTVQGGNGGRGPRTTRQVPRPHRSGRLNTTTSTPPRSASNTSAPAVLRFGMPVRGPLCVWLRVSSTAAKAGGGTSQNTARKTNGVGWGCTPERPGRQAERGSRASRGVFLYDAVEEEITATHASVVSSGRRRGSVRSLSNQKLTKRLIFPFDCASFQTCAKGYSARLPMSMCERPCHWGHLSAHRGFEPDRA